MEEMGQDWTDLVLFWAKFSTAMDKQQWSKRTLSSMIVEHQIKIIILSNLNYLLCFGPNNHFSFYF
jgi:hypothetical protein